MDTKIRKSFTFAVPGLLMILLLGLSCTDLDELNTPPDQIIADNVDASLLGQAFSQAQFHGMRGNPGSGGYQDGQVNNADLYSQYIATTAENFDPDQYVDVGPWTNGAWEYFYQTPAPQVFFVEQFTQENGMQLANAIAKIWRVQFYHRKTDYWGPIPYSSFGNGETSVPYDSQEDIYMDFFTTLDEAVAVLKQNMGGSVFSQYDLIYEGDVDKWLTFANSLRLRLAMRISYVEPDMAEEEAEKAVLDGVMMDNSDNAMVLTTQNSLQPLGVISSWGEFRMSAAMESTMEGFEDPRLPEYWDEIEGGGFEGLRNGLPRTDKGPHLNTAHSNMHTKWRTPAAGGENLPIRVMAAAEVYFLRAEGALRGWEMDGNAQDLYEEGIRMSMSEERNGIPSNEIEAYITSGATPMALDDQWNTPAMSDITVQYDAGGSMEHRLEQIITQKWLALYPDGMEAWAERRRTGYPKGYPIIESLNLDLEEDDLFRRMKFVIGEYNNNTAEVEAAVQLLDGPDSNATRLWWDAKL
ncbi:MAG: SusD/RagB family nutrient-binding outer membrane lipoprotein [Balneolaceae bacterium]